MPRPRFDKLEPARRAAILAVATEEFAEHGFDGASYNRIIERSGLSKGAMYYYFDDKEDLFVAALADVLSRLIVQVGDIAAARTPDDFWCEVEAWYRRSLELCQQEPASIALARNLLKSVERGRGGAALAELRRLGRHHLDDFIARGQRLGAIRDDLPEGLLASVLMALEEGIDVWLLERVAELDAAGLSATARTMTALYRRVAEPAATKAMKKIQAKRKRRNLR